MLTDCIISVLRLLCLYLVAFSPSTIVGNVLATQYNNTWLDPQQIYQLEEPTLTETDCPKKMQKLDNTQISFSKENMELQKKAAPWSILTLTRQLPVPSTLKQILNYES